MREASARDALTAEQQRLAGLEDRWSAEKALVDKVLGLRAALREGAARVEGAAEPSRIADRGAMLAELAERCRRS